MKRKETRYIVIHCSATPSNMDIGAEDIDHWHKERGWSGIGYHEVIRRDGSLELGRGVNAVGAHVRGYNSLSVGVCLVGGVDASNTPTNNFTKAQFKTLVRSLKFYKALFPDALVVGHGELNKGKACPSFDVQEFLAKEGF